MKAWRAEIQGFGAGTCRRGGAWHSAPGGMRKIVHIDMDCFYAAIEEREDPTLRGKPVGVAGSSRRGVLTTANYEARKFGCRSAMPVFKALELAETAA